VVSPGRQAHVDPLHAWAAVHAWPHVPQSSGLFCVSAQTLAAPDAHVVPPDAHVQTPPLHTSPRSHALPHVWQLAGSVFRLVQVVPPQTMSPTGQVQLPLTQVSFAPQTVPQVPQ
jgi:hypothetical protein